MNRRDGEGTAGWFRNVLPYTVAVIVTLLWSSSYVFIKWGLSDIPPLFFATLRYSLAFVVLLTAELVTGSREERPVGNGRRRTALLLVAGLGGYTVAQGFQFVGLYYLPAVTTSFLLNFNPFFVLMLGVGLTGEGATLPQLGGLALALLGAWAFFSQRVAWGGQLFGVAMVIVSGLGWALYVVAVRLVHGYGDMGSLRLTTITMGIGVAGMVVMTLLSGQYAPLTTNGVLIIVWLATANTALAFFLWNWSLRAIPAYELTVLQDLMLIEIAVFAFLFLAETITPIMAGGMALVLAGVVIVQVKAARRSGSGATTDLGAGQAAARRVSVLIGICRRRPRGREAPHLLRNPGEWKDDDSGAGGEDRP